MGGGGFFPCLSFGSTTTSVGEDCEWMGSRKRVVIVGGGFAGRSARRALRGDFEVVLIDAKGYFEYTPSMLRCLVEPRHCRKVVLEHPRDTVVGKVVRVKQGEVDWGVCCCCCCCTCG